MNDLFGERGSVSVSQHVEKFFARNLGKSHPCPDRQAGPVHEGNSRTMNMHADKVSDCARFFPCQPIRHGLMLPSLQRNGDRHLEIRPVSQLNTWPVVSPVNASRLPSRAEPSASLGVGAVG